MRKNELKPGVEYACVSRPVRGRERNPAKPFKATLIDVDFREQRYESRSAHYGNQYILSEKVVYGIAVDTGSKVYIKGDLPVLDAKGHHQHREETDKRGNVLRKRTIVKSAQFEYDYVVLENAGCFLMTWQEWEAEQVAQAEMKARHERERQEKEDARVEAEAGIKARVDAVLEVLGRVGPVKIATDEWRRDGKPDDFYVMNEPGHGHFNSTIKGEFTYGEGPKGRVLTGLVVGSGYKGGGLTLDAMEQILKAAKEEA